MTNALLYQVAIAALIGAGVICALVLVALVVVASRTQQAIDREHDA